MEIKKEKTIVSFSTFQELPSHNLQIPEFRPMPVQHVPVYNTSEAIQPLLQLAQYLSLESRAMRKAAVAKANYEYRAYTSQNPRAALDPLFMYRLRAMQRQDQIRNLQMDKLRRNSPTALLPPEVQSAMKGFGKIPNAYVAPDATTDATTAQNDALSTDGPVEPVEPDTLFQ